MIGASLRENGRKLSVGNTFKEIWIDSSLKIKSTLPKTSPVGIECKQ